MTKETSKKNIVAVFGNGKKEQISSEIMQDLANGGALVNYGYIKGDLYITRLKDNKPSTIATFKENANTDKEFLNFFIIELDEEMAKSRHLWTSKKNIVCDFQAGKATKKGKSFKVNYKDFKNIDDFWRLADYEEARKCAKNIYCVYFKNYLDEVMTKRQERSQRGEAIARYRDIKTDFVHYRFSSSPVYKTDYKKAKSFCALNTCTGKIQNLVCGSNEVLAPSDAGEEVIKNNFDKNGFYLYPFKWSLKQRARALKEQREKEQVNKTNFADELNTLKAEKEKLTASLNVLIDFLKEALAKGLNIDTFYLRHRIEPTIAKIERTNEIISKVSNKNFASVTDILNTIKGHQKDNAQTLFLNRCYMELTPEEKNQDTSENIKVKAIYYGKVKETCDGLALDLEKAQSI